MSFSIRIHQIQSNFALFLGEGAGSHEAQASLEPAWLRLALILLPPAPKLQDYMHVYLCSASNSVFFFLKCFKYVTKSGHSYFQWNLRTECILSQEARLLPEAHQTTQGIPEAQFSHRHTPKVLMAVVLSPWPISVSIWELGPGWMKTAGSKFVGSQFCTKTDNCLCSQGWPWISQLLVSTSQVLGL